MAAQGLQNAVGGQLLAATAAATKRVPVAPGQLTPPKQELSPHVKVDDAAAVEEGEAARHLNSDLHQTRKRVTCSAPVSTVRPLPVAPS